MAFIPLSAMKAAHLQADYAMSDADCNDVIRDMGRVFLMMSQRANRVFGCRGAMWVGGWTNSWIAFRCDVERQQAMLPHGKIIKSSEFHEKFVWMLTVRDRCSIGCLALLK